MVAGESFTIIRGISPNLKKYSTRYTGKNFSKCFGENFPNIFWKKCTNFGVICVTNILGEIHQKSYYSGVNRDGDKK